MPTHTILGAIGSTGSAVVRTLIQTPTPLQINIFIRSRQKLDHLFPNLLQTTHHTIRIFTASSISSDQTTLSACLKNADIIYNCIGTNEITFPNDLDTRTAQTLIATLSTLQTSHAKSYKPPLILVNRTIGLNDAIPNPGPGPGLLSNFIHWSLDWVLEDMRSACKLYESASSTGLLSYVFVDGPKLFEGDATGFELVRRGKTSTALNYGDLGAAFVEIGGRGEKFRDQAVGVSATGKVEIDMVGLVASFLHLIYRGIRGKVFGF